MLETIAPSPLYSETLRNTRVLMVQEKLTQNETNSYFCPTFAHNLAFVLRACVEDTVQQVFSLFSFPGEVLLLRPNLTFAVSQEPKNSWCVLYLYAQKMPFSLRNNGTPSTLKVWYTYNSPDFELLQSGENKFSILKWDSTMIVQCKNLVWWFSTAWFHRTKSLWIGSVSE